MNKFRTILAAVACFCSAALDELSAPFQPRKTDDVLSSINTAVANLDAVVAEREVLSTKTYEKGLSLIEQSVAHDKERERAASVAARLRQLIA
jgi:hypothetical protein